MLNIKLEVQVVIYECIMFRQDIALSHQSSVSGFLKKNIKMLD